MLGIDDKTVRAIASMPKVEHSWIAERINQSQDLDELENQLYQWMKPKVESQTKDNDVWRMVRDSLIPLLENEAIEAFLEQNPQWMGYLPEVSDPQEAVSLAARDLMYIEPSQIKEAEKILRSLQQEVMPPSQQPESDLQS